ncbi:hypothetical protein OAK57_02195 [Synechococcus sp. AH-551-N23]|nr:hypothetical protein [Synechococcus sp. AH-551-N23]
MTLWPILWPQRVYFYCRSDADSDVGLWFDLLSISHLWALPFDSVTISQQGDEKINNISGQPRSDQDSTADWIRYLRRSALRTVKQQTTCNGWNAVAMFSWLIAA